MSSGKFPRASLLRCSVWDVRLEFCKDKRSLAIRFEEIIVNTWKIVLTFLRLNLLLRVSYIIGFHLTSCASNERPFVSESLCKVTPCVLCS